MSQRFPPETNLDKEICQLLMEFKPPPYSNVIYISVPITTGKQFSNQQNFSKESLKNSFSCKKRNSGCNEESNFSKVQNIINNLQKIPGQFLANPMLLNDQPGWTQDDYRVFWARFIENYVNIIIFVDGWQFSNGCVYEFLTAHKRKIPTVDERQYPLTLEQGVEMIRFSIDEIKKQSVSAEFLEKVLKELLNLKIGNSKEQRECKLNP
jgi:hypothetical protein